MIRKFGKVSFVKDNMYDHDDDRTDGERLTVELCNRGDALITISNEMGNVFNHGAYVGPPENAKDADADYAVDDVRITPSDIDFVIESLQQLKDHIHEGDLKLYENE